DQMKVGALSTQAEVVQNDVAVDIVEGSSVSGHVLGLLDVLQDAALALAATAAVAHVSHHLLRASLAILGVVSTAVIEVGDLVPVLEHLLGSQLDVHGEPVAAGTLPASGREPTATTLVQALGTCSGNHVGAKEHNQRSDVVRLEGLDHLLGHDRP